MLMVCLPLAVACAAAEKPAPAEEIVLESDEDKILYTMGVALSRNVAGFDLTPDELALIQAGFEDGSLDRDLRVPPEEWAPRIQTMLQGRMAAITEREKEAGVAFVAEAAKEAGAETLESGLVYRELEPGTGASPAATDRVRLHYHGTLRDGSVFDSSREGENPEPATFSLSGVIPCFTEGVQKMKVGGKSLLTCPSDLAYGERGSAPKIRPGAALQFEIELLEVLASEEPAAETPATSPQVP
jgi:FKBP-type peptidyl-prolyl cis-trans isomerase